ncbi:MAG: hypothetical protein ACK502_10300 [Alphaproteobacteria bacterium]
MSKEDPDRTVPNPERRALFRGLFRHAEKPDTPATSPSSPPPATQNTKTAKGFDRRKFITTSTAVITSFTGLPDSALDILNKAVGITNPTFLPMQHADDWLIGVAKTLEECWGNTARLGNLVGPLGKDECASFFYPELVCNSRQEAIKLDAKGCADLLHIAKTHAVEMAHLQKLGKLGGNALVNAVLKDATGMTAERLSTQFINVGNGDMSALPKVTKQMFRELNKPRILRKDLAKDHSQSDIPEEAQWQNNWQDKVKAQEAAAERAWYDYAWNK